MRFSYKDYDKVFPRQKKVKSVKEEVDPEDVMITEVKEEKEEVEDGNGTVSESDPE